MVDRTRTVAVLTCALLCGPGCAFAPKSQVEDAHKLVQSLRADNAQLKDVALNLKIQNQDLTQRAVDDARSIRALEAANDQYEKSIQGYQDDREELRSAFQELKGQVRTASGP